MDGYWFILIFLLYIYNGVFTLQRQNLCKNTTSLCTINVQGTSEIIGLPMCLIFILYHSFWHWEIKGSGFNWDQPLEVFVHFFMTPCKQAYLALHHNNFFWPFPCHSSLTPSHLCSYIILYNLSRWRVTVLHSFCKVQHVTV